MRSSSIDNSSGPRWLCHGVVVLLAVGAAVLSWAILTSKVHAQANTANPVVAISTQWSATRAHRGDVLAVAAVLDIRDGYHINPFVVQEHEPYLIPTSVEVTDSGTVAPYPLRYPSPTTVEVGPEDNPRQVIGYEGRLVVYLPVQIGAAVDFGQAIMKVKVTYQACDRYQCLLPVVKEVITGPIEIVPASVEIEHAAMPPVFDGYDLSWATTRPDSVGFDFFGLEFDVSPIDARGLATILLIAGFGGFLLNLTPCVLPVIPIKILGLRQAAGNRRRALMLGGIMTLGVITFWLALGGLVAGVSGFTATNQLFQYPAFSLAVGVVIAAMGVGMCGLFSVRLPQWVYAINPGQESITGAFLFGVMTAVLSTPCTAPFMGTAAAWAAGQSALLTLTTFASIGAGMALPYLVLSARPGLVEKIPKTGPASVLVKQVMGLWMLAVAAYFFGVGLSGAWVTPPDPPSVAYWWPVMGLIGLSGAWVGWRAWGIAGSRLAKVVWASVGLLTLGLSGYGAVRLTDHGPIKWVYYTPQRFSDAQEQGRFVVMDFTAQWCLNCKWLERTVLNSPRVVEQLNRDDVVPMKVDLTGHNPDGRQLLQDMDRLTIPLLVIFDPSGSEVFKSDHYTTGQVIDALKVPRSIAYGRLTNGDMRRFIDTHLEKSWPDALP